MKIEFEVSKQEVVWMIDALNEYLDYCGEGYCDHPMDQETYNNMEGLELAQAAYKLGSILLGIFEENEAT